MKRIVSLALALLLMSALFVLPADALTEKDFLSEEISGGTMSGYVENGHAILTGFDSDGSTKKLVLPETMQGYTIETIRTWSFQYSSFTKITLPAKLTSISEYCFDNSKVKAFVLPETLEKIGDDVFANCKCLEKIDLSHVRILGKSAFRNCEKLSEVVFSDKLTEISDNAFSYCKALTDITFPKNLKKVGKKIFQNDTALKEIKTDAESKYLKTVDGVLYNKALTRLYEYPEGKKDAAFTVPEGVTAIAPAAFAYTKKLKTLILPQSLERIGEMGMAESKVETVSFSGSPVVVGAKCFWGCVKMTSIDLKGVTKLGSNVFEHCDLLADIKLPDSLKVIGKKAFSDCKALETITIPKNVEKLGSLLFDNQYFTMLKSIKVDKDNQFFTSKGGVLFTKDMTELITYPRYKTNTVYKIPDSVKVVRSFAFQYAKNLNKVVFSENIKEVRRNVFANCYRLKTVDLGDGMTEWNFVCPGSVRTVIIGKKLKTVASQNNFRHSYTKIKNFKVRKGNKYFASKGGALLSKDLKRYYRYPGARRVDKYRIPDTVKVIEASAFANIYTVNKIVMPDSVTKVKKEAFSWGSVQSVRISRKLIEISERCFAGTRLTKVNIPSNVKKIGKNAFDYCINLKPVILNEGLKTVGDEAFLYCSRLNVVTIPKSVTKIGEHAFGYRDAWSWSEEDEDVDDARYFIHRHSYLIKDYKNSEAHNYAKKNSIRFKAIK